MRSGRDKPVYFIFFNCFVIFSVFEWMAVSFSHQPDVTVVFSHRRGDLFIKKISNLMCAYVFSHEKVATIKIANISCNTKESLPCWLRHPGHRPGLLKMIRRTKTIKTIIANQRKNVLRHAQKITFFRWQWRIH